MTHTQLYRELSQRTGETVEILADRGFQPAECRLPTEDPKKLAALGRPRRRRRRRYQPVLFLC